MNNDSCITSKRSCTEITAFNLRAANRSADVNAGCQVQDRTESQQEQEVEPQAVAEETLERELLAEAVAEQTEEQEVEPQAVADQTQEIECPAEERTQRKPDYDLWYPDDGPYESANPAQVQPEVASSWPALRSEAYCGVVGDLVNLIEPESEADPVGLLVMSLTVFGNVIGRTAHGRAEDTKHFCNLFALAVGQSGHGRKGAALSRVRRLMEIAAPDWLANCIASGMSSGEGLVARVMDDHEENEAGDQANSRIPDKRLLVVETEFGGVLRRIKQSNSLSAIVRDAWDGGQLSILTKKPMTATDTHISIVGHLTDADLDRHLQGADVFNGFANRFLFFAVKRSKLLPEGGRRIDMSDIGKRVNDAITRARGLGELTRSDEARKMWESVYGRLTDARPGLAGVVTSRAEAQVLRLSVLYAALDGARQVELEHLRAALAVWDYCEASAVLLFGDEDPVDRIEERLLPRLRAAGTAGLSRSDIRDVFHRNEKAPRISAALHRLQARGAARVESQKGQGKKPVERWFVTG